jgi:hypothetical protein
MMLQSGSLKMLLVGVVALLALNIDFGKSHSLSFLCLDTRTDVYYESLMPKECRELCKGPYPGWKICPVSDSLNPGGKHYMGKQLLLLGRLYTHNKEVQ